MTIASTQSKEKTALALFVLIAMLFVAGSPLSFVSPGYAKADSDIAHLSANTDIPFGTICVPVNSVPVTVEKRLRIRDDSSFDTLRVSLPVLTEIGTGPVSAACLFADVYMANAHYCGISDPKTVQKRE